MFDQLRRLALLAIVMLCVARFSAMGGEPQSADRPLLSKVTNPLSGDNPRFPLVDQPVPEAGKAIHDAQFGTRLTRLTKSEGLRHEYSRFDPFNVDQSQIVLNDPPQGELRVYRATSAPVDSRENLLATLNLEQPRWDPSDRNMLWGLRDFQIQTFNTKSGKTAVVKDFAQDAKIAPLLRVEKDLYRITTKDEGEPSRDMRFWALALQGSKDDYRLRYILTWDRQTDKVLGLYKLSKEESIDWVGMSWRGAWVLIGADPGRGKIAGLTMSDLALTRFHRLDYATGHADVGLDAAGNEVVVMQNSRTDYIDLIPIDLATKPILESNGSYQGTGRTPLVRLFYDSASPLGLNSGVHISCNAPGWCVVSTYLETGQSENNWLDRCILLVRLDVRRPEAFYLAKVHATRGAYWEETQAVMTNDGSKVLWADNWKQKVGQEKSWLMQLDMPEQWRKQLK